MKPNINLKDPRVQIALKMYHARLQWALEFSHRIENAVFPIYFPLKSKKPEQIGSGVVVRIKNEHFVFSASHVFDSIGQYALMVSAGVGRMLDVLGGDRFSSARDKRGKHAEDPVDASVFHIQSAVPKELEVAALSIDDLDLDQPDSQYSVHLASGFRSNVTKIIGNKTHSKREAFPSMEYSEYMYDRLGIDKQIHLALAYEDQILVDGAWQMSPSPKGISGGAMIKVSGVSISPSSSPMSEPKPLLSGITIAHRREKGGKPGVLIGTRIGVHLRLISRWLPGLLDDLVAVDPEGQPLTRDNSKL